MAVLNEHVKSASPLSIQCKHDEHRTNANRRGTAPCTCLFIIRLCQASVLPLAV